MAKTGPVSFLEVATKRGVTDMTQQIAGTMGSMAKQLAAQKAKQDAADRKELQTLVSGLTPPSKLNKLFKTEAQEKLGGAALELKKLYQTNDPQRAIKGQMITNDYLVNTAGELAAKSVEFQKLEDFSKKPNIFLNKEQRQLVQNYSSSNSYEEFLKKSEENPTPNFFDPTSGQLSIPQPKAKIPIQNTINLVFDNVNPVQLGKGGASVIVETEKEADDIQKTTGVRPNTIEQASQRLFEDRDFLEQYVDSKGFDINVDNLTPENIETIRTSLMEDGKPFLMKKYPNEMKFSITNKVGEDTKGQVFGFTENTALSTHSVTVDGKNVNRLTPIFNNVVPMAQPEIDVPVLKGTLDRNGNQVTGVVSKKSKLTGIGIIPYTIGANGVNSGVFDATSVEAMKKSTGFQVYYQFGGGDLYVPSSQMSNLQFNVGGKDPVATQQYVLSKLKERQAKMNEYHKTIGKTKEKPLLYVKLAEYANGKITADEYENFLTTFKYDQ